MKLSYLFALFTLLATTIYAWSKKRTKSGSGCTIYKPIGIKTEYPIINLEGKLVTAVVTYQDQPYMKVMVNLSSDTVNVEGNLQQLPLSKEVLNEKEYIEQIKMMAKFYVDNQIDNPEAYYEE